MTEDHPEQAGRVPVDELKELVEEWRRKADGSKIISDEQLGEVRIYAKTADELQELVEQYE